MDKQGKRFPERLWRFEGRTVLFYSDSIDVHFDSENDRIEFEEWCDLSHRFLEAANQQDYAEAARILAEALNDGTIIFEEDELIEKVADDTTREVIRLEFEKIYEESIAHLVNAIRMRWPIEGGEKP